MRRKRQDEIELSPKYGVNPTIPLCFYCNGPKNEVRLLGRIRSKDLGKDQDIEAPRAAVWDQQPCDRCREHMKQGIILISVRDTDIGTSNPYRTGGWAVVKEEAIRRMFGQVEEGKPLLETMLKWRVAFVPDEAWDLLELPRGEGKPEAAKSDGGS